MKQSLYESFMRYARTSVIADGMDPDKSGIKLCAERVMLITRGHSLGMDPAQSLSSLYRIKGHIVMSGEAMLARAFASGNVAQWDMQEDKTNKRVVLKVARKGKPAIKQERVLKLQDFEHIIKTAKEGSPWKNYPYRMLIWRCTAFAVRDIFPEVTCGLLSLEEAAEIYGGEFVSAAGQVTTDDALKSAEKSATMKAKLAEARERAQQNAAADSADADETEAEIETQFSDMIEASTQASESEFAQSRTDDINESVEVLTDEDQLDALLAQLPSEEDQLDERLS